MLKIENISHSPQRFTAKGGKRVEIAPGDSASVAIARDSVRVAAKERAGLIRVAEQRPARKAKVPRRPEPKQVPVTEE